MSVALEPIDLAILSVLEQEGRLSIAEVGQRVHISRSAVYDRVQRLRAAGVISGFTARLDPTLLGLGLAAFVTIATEQASWSTIAEGLRALPQIEYAAATAGNFDAIVLVRVRTLRRADANASV